MTKDQDARIRERAYRIWESEGRPDDRHQVHWDIARRIIDEEDATPARPDAVDEAGADSFPASDPSAIGAPTRSIETDRDVLSAERESEPSPRRRRA